MLKRSPEAGAEEWAVHDFENFQGIELSESPDLARVSSLATVLEVYGKAFALWYEYHDGQYIDSAELEEKFLEQWQGAHASKSSFADNLLEDTGQLRQLPEWAQNYFDTERFARDLELSGDYTFVSNEGQVYVYSHY